MSDLIRWEDNGYGGFLGYAGLTDGWLFQIWRDPLERLDAVLMSRIITGECPRAADPELLKPEAERLLREFAASIGAVFPESAMTAAAYADRALAALAVAGIRPDSESEHPYPVPDGMGEQTTTLLRTAANLLAVAKDTISRAADGR